MLPRALVRKALSGRWGGRPLLGPRMCAIAGEMDGLSPLEFLSSSTKMANLLTELQRGTGLDVIWVESGSRLELEVAGLRLDWTEFPPKPIGRPGFTIGSEVDPAVSRLGTALEAGRRLRSVLADRAALAYCFAGPASLVQLTDGVISEESAAALLLSIIRLCCQAGADLIVVAEQTEAPGEPAAYASLLRPLISTARFFQALPVLAPSLHSAGWSRVLRSLGSQVVPCLRAQAGDGTGLPADELSAVSLELDEVQMLRQLDLRSCALITTPDELTGAIPLAAVRDALLAVRAAIPDTLGKSTGQEA